MVLTPPQDKRPSQARRLTRAALLTAIALTIFLAEAQLPPPVPIPGIKLGLANIVTVYAMFVLGPRDTLLILLSRIFLGAVFSGQMMTLLDRSNPLFPSDYAFRDIYLLATAADSAESSMDGAVKGLEGWIACFEKAALRGVVRGTGADGAGTILQVPAALKSAFELGNKA